MECCPVSTSRHQSFSRCAPAEMRRGAGEEVFAKKTRATPKAVIDTCKKRFKEAFIDLRLRLADGLKSRRQSRGVTQSQLAQSLRSSQSRVAKMEAGEDNRETLRVA